MDITLTLDSTMQEFNPLDKHHKNAASGEKIKPQQGKIKKQTLNAAVLTGAINAANIAARFSILKEDLQTFAGGKTHELRKQMDQNFGLTQETFDEMLKALQNGDKSMFEWVFLKHFSACRDYLVRTHRASYEDAYDVTMDTLLAFHRLLLESKIRYGNLRYLFTKMGSQLYLKNIKKHPHLSEEGLDAAVQLADADAYDKEAERQLQKAWHKLGEGCQQLLHAFYYEGKGLNLVAETSGKDHAAVRKQKQRCVDLLRLHFNRYA